MKRELEGRAQEEQNARVFSRARALKIRALHHSAPMQTLFWARRAISPPHEGGEIA